jgi:hypothetical protein
VAGMTITATAATTAASTAIAMGRTRRMSARHCT